MLLYNLLHSEVHKQTIHTGLKHYFGHYYELFSCLRIRLAEGKKELTLPWLYFVMKQFVGKSSRWVYNEVGGSGGILPRENLNFQNLRNAIFGPLALMFALLQKLSLLN